ncbi:MAG: hypothetical protein Q8P05_01305 [Candidatus Diapherotrites archaeon]|nr:hypothetical protein [Candidatus Diapherotrites archaeon]MDZ4256411.1 hypothetical protein [archaeon]
MEGWTLIPDAGAMEERLEGLGATIVQEYAREDRYHFLPGHTSLEKGYIRIRGPENEGGLFLIQKMVRMKGKWVEAYRSHHPHFGAAKRKTMGHWQACLLVRRGKAFLLGEAHIRVEHIEGYGDVVAIKADNDPAFQDIISRLALLEMADTRDKDIALDFLIQKNAKPL